MQASARREGADRRRRGLRLSASTIGRLALLIESGLAAAFRIRVKAQGTRRTDQTPANRPGWKLEGPAPLHVATAQARRRRPWGQSASRSGRAAGGASGVEAHVRALFETRLSPIARLRAGVQNPSSAYLRLGAIERLCASPTRSDRLSLKSPKRSRFSQWARR
jgi:hypothetical protein